MQLINWKWKGDKVIAIFNDGGKYLQWISPAAFGEKIAKMLADERAEANRLTRRIEPNEWLQNNADVELKYFAEDEGEWTDLEFGPALMLTDSERNNITTLLRQSDESHDVTGLIRDWNKIKSQLSKKLCYER